MNGLARCKGTARRAVRLGGSIDPKPLTGFVAGSVNSAAVTGCGPNQREIIMKYAISILAASVLLVVSVAFADLEPWTDYEVSDAVWSVSTIKVNSNMGDAYLEGIRDTWVKGNEMSKKLGHIEDYAIYRSELPESGEFNLMLVVKFANDSDLSPNKERYDQFMAEWGKDNADAATAQAQRDYPGMRTITGEYRMREITLK
jgi:hypothetical protein